MIFFFAGKIKVNSVFWLTKVDTFIYCFFNRWVLKVIRASFWICCIPMSRHSEWWRHWILFLRRSFVHHQIIMVVIMASYRFNLADNIGEPWVIFILSIWPHDFVYLTFINNYVDEVGWTCRIPFLYNPTIFELAMMATPRWIMEVLMMKFNEISIIIGFFRFYWYNIFFECEDSVV